MTRMAAVVRADSIKIRNLWECATSPPAVAARGNEPVATALANSRTTALAVTAGWCKLLADVAREIRLAVCGGTSTQAASFPLRPRWETAFSPQPAVERVNGLVEWFDGIQQQRHSL